MFSCLDSIHPNTNPHTFQQKPKAMLPKKPSPYQPTRIILQKSQPHGVTSLSTTQPHLKSLRNPTTLPKNKSNPKQCSQKNLPSTMSTNQTQESPKENLPLINQHQ